MTDDAEEKALKISHAAIEDAIREHMQALEINGILTGWVLGASITHFDEGEEYDGLYSTTSDSLSKWANIGITTMLLDGAKDISGQVVDD
jgi:hypothetical protein